VLQAMEQDAGQKLNALRVDGGASANGYLMQTQSDLCDAAVVRPKCVETTAMGAAYLAGPATGYWKDLKDIQTVSKTLMLCPYQPQRMQP
jgi:glycerol kinase